MATDHEPVNRVRIEVAIDRPEDVGELRGALLAARATERAEIHRRDFRQVAGYGSESAREGMTAEVRQHARRVELLDRLIEALPKG
jgi:hypothetical protein